MNLPDVTLDAGKSQRCDADTTLLENNVYCLDKLEIKFSKVQGSMSKIEQIREIRLGVP